MPPSSTPPMQQDFLNALSILSQDERANVMKLVIALSNHGNRDYRCRFVLQILARIDTSPIFWSVLNQHEGKQRLIANLVNGQITGIEINGHV